MTTQTAILAPTTAGGTSSEFGVGIGADVTVSISGAAAALAGAETATAQYKDASGTWRAEVDAITGAAQIAAGETSITIKKHGTWRVVLTETAALTGLEIVDCNK
jgi:hypothetical protein